jgi:hypothetical protein
MKISKRSLCKTLVLLLLVTNPVFADDWFDSYPRLRWVDETVRLRLLAPYLQRNPDKIAYISCHWTNEKDRIDMTRRLHRAGEYLVHILGISSDRIVVIIGGQREYSKTIIQPKDRGLPPPDFK